jgi:hypothetical protein
MQHTDAAPAQAAQMSPRPMAGMAGYTAAAVVEGRARQAQEAMALRES